MIGIEEERCRTCPDHRFNGGTCTRLGNGHPCSRRSADPSVRLEWVDKHTRPPTIDDADPWGCIIIWDTHNGIMITAYNNHIAIGRENVTHFARIPAGPKKEEV